MDGWMGGWIKGMVGWMNERLNRWMYGWGG